MASKKKYSDEEQALRDSLGGSAFDKEYMSTDELQSIDNIVKSAQAGTTTWDAAHDYAEGIRNNYGYSGGENGHDYIKTATQLPAKTNFEYAAYTPSYAELPSYTSAYQDQIDAALNNILNREAFSYDYTTDPRWQAYKKEYTREGQRATADALGQAAAATGGMPSTAAMTAATQAGDYYRAQMTDKIPELYQLAYQQYQNEGNDLYNRLDALRGLENTNYSRYLDDVNQYNRDREFDYNQYLNERDQAWNEYLNSQDFDYQRAADQLAQQNYTNEFNYQMESDRQAREDQERALAMDRVMNYLNAGGSASALDPALLESSGLTPAETKAFEDYYNQQMALSASRGRGGSGGGGGSDKPSTNYKDIFKKVGEFDDKNAAGEWLYSMYLGGDISEDEMEYIARYYGLMDDDGKKTPQGGNGGGTSLKPNLSRTK